MRKKSIQAIAIAIGVMGCASSAETEVTPIPSIVTSGGDWAFNSPDAYDESTAAVTEVATVDDALTGYDEAELAVLPAAPWADAPIEMDAAPEALMSAWNDAENRTSCAPVIPRGIEGSPSRATNLDGGWALEFDQAGAPGLRADGRTCARCGRASFGVAGTAMSADELADADTDAMPAPVYNDGSTADVVAEDGVAAATLTIGGQDCVYQVWSFLGEDHLRSLVEDLRIVAVDTDSTDAVASF